MRGLGGKGGPHGGRQDRELEVTGVTAGLHACEAAGGELKGRVWFHAIDCHATENTEAPWFLFHHF